jgi:hypothetical protein
MPQSLNYVSWIGNGRIDMVCREPALRRQLKLLGGKRRLLRRSSWILAYENEMKLAETLSALRDLGLAFVGGVSDWPPSAVFSDLRNKGLLHGDHQELLWEGPEKMAVSNVE